MDVLLSEALQVPRLTINYLYGSPDGHDSVLGTLEYGNKPHLHLNMDNKQMLAIIRSLSNRSEVCFTLLESLLHHKTHQNGLNHYDPSSTQRFYKQKEELRRRFYEYMQRHALEVEDCLDHCLGRREDQTVDYVPPDELARLSKFRILGLMQERERLRMQNRAAGA